MNVTEKGVPKPPEDLSFITNPILRDLWNRWVVHVWNCYPRVRVYEPELTPAAVNANDESVQTFTIAGLTTKDNVSVNKPTNQSGLDLVHAWVSATDTLSLKYRNVSGGGITPDQETYRVVVLRR